MFYLLFSHVDNGPCQQHWPVEPEWRAERMENTHAVGPVALYDPGLLYFTSGLKV